MRMVLAAGVLALVCGSAVAQTPPKPMASEAPKANCAAMDVKLPPEYASWAAKGAVTSAKAPGDLAKAQLAVGKAVSATLLPTPSLTYTATPEKPGGSVSKGGLFQVKIETAGTYFIALGAPPWIDLIDKDGKAAESTAHGHGPDCTTIRKVVDFKLAPGTYTLQVSSANMDKLDVLVGKRP